MEAGAARRTFPKDVLNAKFEKFRAPTQANFFLRKSGRSMKSSHLPAGTAQLVLSLDAQATDTTWSVSSAPKQNFRTKWGNQHARNAMQDPLWLGAQTVFHVQVVIFLQRPHYPVLCVQQAKQQNLPVPRHAPAALSGSLQKIVMVGASVVSLGNTRRSWVRLSAKSVHPDILAKPLRKPRAHAARKDMASQIHCQ